MPNNRSSHAEGSNERPLSSRIAGWLMASDDEISIGPRVPARVRVLWGLFVLGALIWLIALQHQVLDQLRTLQTRSINHQVMQESRK